MIISRNLNKNREIEYVSSLCTILVMLDINIVLIDGCVKNSVVGYEVKVTRYFT